jgi:hypothetical protein
MKTDHDIIEKHKRYVFLDDYRMPEDAFSYTNNQIYLNNKWIVVRSYDEFINDVKRFGVSDFYSFDHDLADIHYTQEEVIPYDSYIEKTGFHCAKWLIEYCMDNKLQVPTGVLIHSMNPIGRKNIRSLFSTYNKVMDLPSGKIYF